MSKIILNKLSTLYFCINLKDVTKLSVNINKIATLRNARGGNSPNLIQLAKDIQDFGAHGITIHPRPDERHIRYKDAYDLKDVVYKEYNIEGNPTSNEGCSSAPPAACLESNDACSDHFTEHLRHG